LSFMVVSASGVFVEFSFGISEFSSVEFSLTTVVSSLLLTLDSISSNSVLVESSESVLSVVS
jgi:hypothetical protein